MLKINEVGIFGRLCNVSYSYLFESNGAIVGKVLVKNGVIWYDCILMLSKWTIDIKEVGF